MTLDSYVVAGVNFSLDATTSSAKAVVLTSSTAWASINRIFWESWHRLFFFNCPCSIDMPCLPEDTDLLDGRTSTGTLSSITTTVRSRLFYFRWLENNFVFDFQPSKLKYACIFVTFVIRDLNGAF